MAAGEVKWFNNAKGWGFLVPDGGGNDIFVHYSVIKGEGYKTLVAGQKVNFDLTRGDRGEHASNVSVMQAETVD
jgi:CspA family cold shock protein